MPENQSGAGSVFNAEEIELGPQPAMIAALGFFDLVQVFIELRLREETRPVNALHLRVALRALPVSAGDVRQLNALMRPVEGMCGPRQKSMNFPVV